MKTFARRALLGVAILAVAAGSVVAQQYDRRMNVHNNSSQTIMYLYSTNTGTNDWGGDILGSSVIQAGQTILVDFNDGSGYCRMDIRAEFADGTAAEARRVNVCEETDVYFE